MIAAANRNPELRAAVDLLALKDIAPHMANYNITLQVFTGQATLHEAKCERQASVRFANAQAAEAAKEACDAGQARSFLAPGRLLLL